MALHYSQYIWRWGFPPEILNTEQDITQISFDHTQIICSAESQ